MSYQVISRKYRPQKFEDVVGQSHICNTLQNAIKNDRVAHAYLFTGSRGIGKTTTARILAKSLNCSDSQDYNPCNACTSCIEITEGRSINVAEIDGASNRGINEIRDLRENVKYPPTNASYRIFIIDEVHMLTKEAFNALLKTLEEPPPHVIFMFATTEPIKIPDTIISRCQRYDFHRIHIKNIVEQLKAIVKIEGVEVDDNILMMIAKKADGGMRDAESLLDQVISFSGDKVNFEEAQRILGLIDVDYFIELGNMVLSHDQKSLVYKAGEIFNKGVEINEFLEGFSEHFRNILITKVAGSVEMLDLPDDVRKNYWDESQKWDAGDLLRLIKMLTESQAGLKSSLNQRMHLEFCLLRMGAMENTISIQEILQQLNNDTSKPFTSQKKKTEIKKTLQKEPNLKKIDNDVKTVSNGEQQIIHLNPQTVQKKQTNKPDLLTITEIRDNWKNVIKTLTNTKKSLASFLENAELISYENSILELSFHVDAKFQKESVEKRSDVIEQILKSIYNTDIKLKCIFCETNKNALPSGAKVDELAQLIAVEFDGDVIL